MRRQYLHSKYARRRLSFCLSDDAPTLEELWASRERAAEEKAKAATQGNHPTQQPQGSQQCAE